MTTTTDTTKTKGARQAVLATVLLLALALSHLLVAPARQAEALPPGDGCWPYCDEEPPPPPSPPRNDAFSGAITLPVPGLLTGSTSLATMEAGEPRPYSPYKDCGIYGVSNSVSLDGVPDRLTLSKLAGGHTSPSLTSWEQSSSLSCLFSYKAGAGSNESPMTRT